MHFSHVNGFPHWLPLPIGALRSPEKLNAFSKDRAGPKYDPIPPVSLIALNQESGEPENFPVIFFFFFLLNTFPPAQPVFSFVMEALLQGEAVLCSNSPLFLHTKGVEKCGIFGLCLCGSIFFFF